MAPAQKVKYLRIPFGLLVLVIFVLLAAHPHRSRQGDSPHRDTPITWKECLLLYAASVGTFSAVLYMWENIKYVLWPTPRRLSLSDDYINANPPVVDKMAAFEYDTPVTWYEQAKFYFFLLTGISLLRILVMVFVVIAGMWIFTLGGKEGMQKKSLRFLVCANTAVFCGHVGLAAMGFYNVRQYGRVVDLSECKLLVGNHNCVIEVLIMFLFNGFPSLVSRKENLKVPVFSKVCVMCDAILVDRDAVTSRKQTLDAIVARAKDATAPQLMIFPEGTTGNQRTLFLFKKGAFEAGEPVQMICFSFPYKYFNPAWTGRGVGGNNMSDMILRLASQFVNHVEIRALPVYHPTEAEKADPLLYADHCQKMMAAVLRENVSNATFKDYKEAEALYAARLAEGKAKKSA